MVFTVITPPPSSGCRVALAALNCDFTMSSRRQPRSLAQLHLMEGVSEKQPRGLTVSSSPSGGRQHRRFRPALNGCARLRKGEPGDGRQRQPKPREQKASDQRRSCASDRREHELRWRGSQKPSKPEAAMVTGSAGFFQAVRMSLIRFTTEIDDACQVSGTPRIEKAWLPYCSPRTPRSG